MEIFTDEDIEKKFKENYSKSESEALIDIFHTNRAAGEDVYNAYMETLQTYVVIERNLP